ncbi:type II/IV secretion system ATPase subunit [Halorutilales archaeon Cl-col2-1]
MGLRRKLSELASSKSSLEARVDGYDPTPEDMFEFEPPSRQTEVRRYWLNEPYSTAVVTEDDDGVLYYNAVEPSVTDFERELLNTLYYDLRDVLSVKEFGGVEENEEVLKKGMIDLIQSYGVAVDPVSFHRILYYLRRSYMGMGKIEPLLEDPYVEDISCHGYGAPIYLYHGEYQDIRTNIQFDEDELNSLIITLSQKSGKHISIERPIVSASLPDGSRVELTLGKEVTQEGSTFTIRKFSEEPFTPAELIKSGTFSAEQMAYLWVAIENNRSLIFAGGTASGKTTSLNAVSMFIPPRSKVISIEDTPEIRIHHENWVPSVTREGIGVESEIDMYTLLRSALRQRPEYIIVGEVRGEEAMTLFQAMSTGHTTYSTLHADSIETAINRLENPPIDVPRSMLEALDILSIQVLTRYEDERVRRNNVLAEIAGIDSRTGDINVNTLYEWNPSDDTVDQISESVVLKEIRDDMGLSRAELMGEIRTREKILRYLVENDITDFREFTNLVNRYYTNPEKELESMGIQPEGETVIAGESEDEER